MARFNVKTPAPVTSRTGIATTSVSTPDTVTSEGGDGFTYDAKSELFLLGVSNMVGQNSFYETGEQRDDRFTQLARRVAVEDGDWFQHFVAWLRESGNMRTASLVLAAEGVHARRAAGVEGGNRQIINLALQRADEPAELIAYWELMTQAETTAGGRKKAALPMPVKRGIAEAVERLYTEYSAFKYDTAGKGKRFADVLALTHASATGDYREQLHKWLIARRYKLTDGEYPLLKMVEMREALDEIPQDKRRAYLESSLEEGAFATDTRTDFQTAGVTWEWLASWLGGKLNAAFWEVAIPSMGYMALLRNLRNFDEAKISKKSIRYVQDFLSDPNQVAKSRQFPFRFWMAAQQVPSENWNQALEEALTLSVKNIPELPGRTLILADTSGSMGSYVSDKSKMTMVEAAGLFGAALAVRNPGSNFYGFANNVFELTVAKGSSVLKAARRFEGKRGSVGHGTEIFQSLQTTYNGHDRVILLSDMQTMDSDGTITEGGWGHRSKESVVPANIPIYAFNLAGYGTAALPSTPTRHNIGGGYTDAAFKLIPLLEAGTRGGFPWEH